MPRIMGVTNARQTFTELVSEADEDRVQVYVTHFGEPRAVIIGYEAFEQLQQLYAG